MITQNQILNNTYQIIGQLGSGGGGIVFKAYHLRLEKYVAIKLIKENVKGVVNERAEADILKRLKHEGLPQVYDFINDGEDVYTVMEFIDGCSLFDEIVSRKKIPYKQALEWAKQLCSAAAYLHTRKPPIIHSDIKPQNIMITSEGKVCLIDFNISSIFDGNIYTIGSSDGYSPPEQYLARAHIKPHLHTSAPAYAANQHTNTEILLDAPEDDATEIITDNCGNDKTEILTDDVKVTIDNSDNLIDSRSDVYSIGAVMYSMVTGMKPNNSRGTVIPLKKIDENIPEAFAYIIEKAMSKEKEKRFPSAVEMLTALNNINKLDKRYKRMALRQQLAFIFCLMLLTGSVISTIAGYRLIQTESADRLDNYIAMLQDISASGNYSDFEVIFSAATSEYPNSIEPYYYKAYMLYSEQNYDEAESCLSEYVISNINGLPDKLQSDTYLMNADILFRREDYQNAAAYYENAIVSNPEKPDIYRDYAISLARIGNTEKAEQVLQVAVNYGLTEDGIYMVTGEIQFMRNEFSAAVDSLKNSIAVTEDDIMKRNAYLLCSRAYKEQYSIDNKNIILENIALLEEALLELPQDMTMQIKEYLTQSYIDYGEVSGNDEYFAKAISLIEDLKYSDKIKSYQLDMNLAVLCDKIGSVERSKELLLDMAAKQEYSMHYYTIYLRLAYCEADIQSRTDINSRDYTEFDNYYLSAEDEYKKYTENGNSDPEMDKLRQLRNEMVSLGWLD